MGISILIDCVSEFPAFHFQGRLLRYISLEWMINISIMTYGIRVACYCLLPYVGSPWAVLPVQLLHGVSWALGYGASSIKGKRLAPEGLQATMQGIFQAVHGGIGAGVSSLLGGFLMGQYGSQLMFAISAATIGAGWGVSLVWGLLLHRRQRRCRAVAGSTKKGRLVGDGQTKQ